MAFQDAGASTEEVEKLTKSASFASLGPGGPIGDLLGYIDGAAMDVGEVEMTSELLADVMQLVHPDRHPPERRGLAHSVTQRLLALQAFVFPAPKPKPEPKPEAEPSWSMRVRSEEPVSSSPRYPCIDCSSAFPMDYCTACAAEYERREQKEFEKRTEKQRAHYRRWRERTLRRRPKQLCERCGKKFESRRARCSILLGRLSTARPPQGRHA